jgi:hypothetical protein
MARCYVTYAYYVIATDSINYVKIGFSNTNRPSRKVVTLTGGTVGFSYIGTGTAAFSIGRYNGPFSAEKSNYYLDVLNDAKQIHVILQDMEQRRAWQTDAERAILHIILHRHTMGAYVIDGEIVKFRTADADAPGSIRQAMVENADIVVAHDQHMTKRIVKTKVFRDLVEELYAVFEGLDANARNEAIAGIELKMDWKKRIQGYEYMDLVHRKHSVQLKEAQLRKTCGQWPDYARDINAVVLFGTNFGEVFQPTQTISLCRPFRTVPKGKDYLAVEVSILRKLYSEHGSLKDRKQITATGTRWHRSNQLFEPCPRGKARGKGPCKCERIQEFVPKRSLWPVRLPGPLGRSGAVIFGQGTSRWVSQLTRSLSNVRDTPQKQDTVLPSHPATLLPALSRNAENSGMDLKDWDPEGVPLRHSTLYQIENMPLDRAIKPNSADTRLENLDTKSTILNPSVRRSGYPSFRRTESTSLSTGQTSNTAATDLEYITPATSEHTRSDREHAAYAFKSN